MLQKFGTKPSFRLLFEGSTPRSTDSLLTADVWSGLLFKSEPLSIYRISIAYLCLCLCTILTSLGVKSRVGNLFVNQQSHLRPPPPPVVTGKHPSPDPLARPGLPSRHGFSRDKLVLKKYRLQHYTITKQEKLPGMEYFCSNKQLKSYLVAEILP